MSHTIAAGGSSALPNPLTLLLLVLLAGGLLYYFTLDDPPEIEYATANAAGDLPFSYEVIHDELTVDWTNGGDFDPRGKCPKDFFRAGFVMIFKQVKGGGYFKYLFHRGKKLLYRVDKDMVQGKAVMGLHWVESTRFSGRYRIADPAFKDGKTLDVPNAKGGTDAKTFQYGEPVSKKRSQKNRELFSQTHIQPGQCPEWWDVFNFVP